MNDEQKERLEEIDEFWKDLSRVYLRLHGNHKGMPQLHRDIGFLLDCVAELEDEIELLEEDDE